MKRAMMIVAMLVVLAGAVLFAPAPVVNAAGCGFHGFPPRGCKDSDAVCICDDKGNCHWEWHCAG